MSQYPRTARLVALVSLGLVVAYAVGEASAVDLLNLDGSRSRVGDGRRIGLMRPAVAAAASSCPELAGQVERGEPTALEVTSTGDIAGPGIEVIIRNPGPADVCTTIPCGFPFTFAGLLDMFSSQAEQWLDRCGIPVP